jgi:hypothetical protein
MAGHGAPSLSDRAGLSARSLVSVRPAVVSACERPVVVLEQLHANRRLRQPLERLPDTHAWAMVPLAAAWQIRARSRHAHIAAAAEDCCLRVRRARSIRSPPSPAEHSKAAGGGKCRKGKSPTAFGESHAVRVSCEVEAATSGGSDRGCLSIRACLGPWRSLMATRGRCGARFTCERSLVQSQVRP